MNLLTINSFDCSAEAGGGVNRMTVLLSREFRKRGIGCYLGFYEDIPETFARAPFEGRIKLSRHFDDNAFASFLRSNKINIVQVNFLKKENLPTISRIYATARQLGVKVIYAFHMCPGFQTVTYGSWEMVKYCVRQKKNVSAETKKWLMTVFRPLIAPFERLYLRPKYRIPYENCDVLVTLSESYFKPYIRLAGVTDNAKFKAIGNTLRFEEYITQSELSKKQKTVIVVARFDEDTKRISIAFRAWRKIQNHPVAADWQLQLVGEGRDRAFYEYLIDKWNLKRVVFTGLQNPQPYYRDASLFLMMSSAEGWPMVVTEACQQGTVVIAMDSFGALHNIIENGYNGTIVPNNNLPAFTEAIEELMRDESRRQQYARNAVESSKRFETPVIIDKWLKLFNSLLK